MRHDPKTRQMPRTTQFGRLKLLALILAFFGPLFAAMLLYLNPQWFPLPASTSHGELITPARPLAAFAAVSRDGRTLSEDLLTGKWTLLYWSDADCDLECEAGLFKMRQVRLSLAKDVERAQTVYLSAGEAGSGLASLLDRHPSLVTARLKPGNAFAEQIHAYPRKHVYVIDPLGNLVMRYPGTATSRGMLKDLKKLLRVSRIG